LIRAFFESVQDPAAGSPFAQIFGMGQEQLQAAVQPRG
jgi:hypothetical protein